MMAKISQPYKKAALLSLLIALLAGIVIVGYCFYLSFEIEKRFSGRRWQIPSRVFSDVTLLFPGQRINKTLFFAKLKDLGYQEVNRHPELPGQMHILPAALTVFLKGIRETGEKREGFPVMIRFDADQIISIDRVDLRESIPLLEIEAEELMHFFGPEREQRRLVSIDQVPEHLVHAILAIEDNRFFRHPGVDPIGIIRALLANLRSGAIRQGGSTLSQQLAKNYFLTPERTLSRKIKELLLALTMEALYNKKTILEIYLNEIYFGQKGSVSINGIGEAADFYFAKSVDLLSLNESAVLAGLIKAPNRYSPHAHPEAARIRRNQVLSAMFKEGWITEKQQKETESLPIRAASVTRYGKRAPYFMDHVSEQLALLYPKEVLSGSGFAIHTTLDTQVQSAAEKALDDGLKRLEKIHPELKRVKPTEHLQGGLIVMHPKTGAILALVGGRDYGSSQFNRMTQARRQPGSTIKPFVYLSALDSLTPASLLSNEPKTFTIDSHEWQPKNYKPVFRRQMRLKEALAESVNLATVDLAMRVGIKKVVEMIRKFGFSTPIHPYPAVSLGVFEVIPLELATAYCVFAGDGEMPFPLSLKEVYDEKGKTLQRKYMTLLPVIPQSKAYLMTSMLEFAVTHGTARSLSRLGISFPVAGKTGTTNAYRDAWFVGYTPEILALVWVGFDNNSSTGLTGAEAALPIWAELMSAIKHRISGNMFKVPEGVVKKNICVESGELAVPGFCPTIEEEVFLDENPPQRECTLHTTEYGHYPDRQDGP